MIDKGVIVSLSMSVRGLLPWASMSDGAGKDIASRSLFKKGMGMRVLVRSVDKEQHRLIFTLKGDEEVVKDLRFVWFSLAVTCQW